MRGFYLAWPDVEIFQTASEKSAAADSVQTPSGKSLAAKGVPNAAIEMSDYTLLASRFTLPRWLYFAGPLFEAVWPYEAQFKRAAVSRELTALCTTTGTAFEEKLSALRHFLTSIDGGWYVVSILVDSKAASTNPETCLHFLWLLSGPGESGRSMELATVLDHIIEAAPDLQSADACNG